jgi:hypothetical protein
MEAVLFAFVLGAGTVLAAKHGRRVARKAIGWTAERTGFISGRVTEALAEARRVAREQYEAGRRENLSRTELPPAPASSNGGATAVTQGGAPSANGGAAPSSARAADGKS